MSEEETNMADRKSRIVTFKAAFQVNVGVLKMVIERVTSEEITVFENIGNDEFLVELKSKNVAEALIEEGFHVEELHVCCHPPQGYYTNVSIMGLRSYVEDDEVTEALTPYGEIKSENFRPKYKRYHELAGIENGNRLVKFILTRRLIPYSMKIGGQLRFLKRILASSRHGFQEELKFLSKFSLHPSRIIAMPSRISAKT